MDLNDDDIRLLAQIRKRRRFAPISRFIWGLGAVGFLLAALALGVIGSPPEIPRHPDPELDIRFEILRWQTRHVWMSLAFLLGFGSLFSAMLRSNLGTQNRTDALALKLLDQRSGFPPGGMGGDASRT